MTETAISATDFDATMRPATAADADRVAELLTECFMDDPLTRWILPDPRARRAALPGFFAVFVELSLDHGGIRVAGDCDAALLYLSPAGLAGAQRRDEEVQRRLAAAVGPGAAALLTILGLQAAHHPAHREHYYASFGCVRPDLQRRGCLTAMLGWLVERADREGVPVYAEASSPGGAATCLRLGFAPVGTAITLPDGPTLRPLWREPR